MKENTFLFSTRKPLNRGFATLNLGQFCAVILADIFNKNKPFFLPALDTSYLITKVAKLNNFLQNL